MKLHKNFIQFESSAADNGAIPSISSSGSAIRIMYFGSLVSQLRSVLSAQALSCVFQPIIDLRRRDVMGYEALLRGPVDSPLYTPQQLLRVAREAGLGPELEGLALRLALESFVATRLPGRVFINLSAAMIGTSAPLLVAIARQTGLVPEQVVVEWNDRDGAPDLDGGLELLASHGIAQALVGQANRVGAPWPAFVKLDATAIRRIHDDPLRRAAVAGFIHQARQHEAEIIAEGVEDARELLALHELGCDHAQGFLLGRPAAEPVRQLSRGVAAILSPRPTMALTPAARALSTLSPQL